jgi:hypothetical protein
VFVHVKEGVAATEDVRVGAIDRTVTVPLPVEDPVIAKVPDVVMVDGVTDSQAGTVIEIEDTYMIGAVQVRVDPAEEVRKYPRVPDVVGRVNE